MEVSRPAGCWQAIDIILETWPSSSFFWYRCPGTILQTWRAITSVFIRTYATYNAKRKLHQKFRTYESDWCRTYGSMLRRLNPFLHKPLLVDSWVSALYQLAGIGENRNAAAACRFLESSPSQSWFRRLIIGTSILWQNPLSSQRCGISCASGLGGWPQPSNPWGPS